MQSRKRRKRSIGLFRFTLLRSVYWVFKRRGGGVRNIDTERDWDGDGHRYSRPERSPMKGSETFVPLWNAWRVGERYSGRR